MKRFQLLFRTLLAFLAYSVPAQTPQPSPVPVQPESRYLFIVDTSSAMSRHNEAVRQIVYELISSGMNGQMRKGDSYALWTYNEQNYPGVFPLQTWNPYDPVLAGGRAALFLKKQRYEKQAKPQAVIPDLAAVIETARDLTVYWISDGYTELKGTAFDELINATYFYKIRAMKKNPQPLVTTLIAQDRKIAHWAVSLASEPRSIPLTPPKPVIATKPPAEEKANVVVVLPTIVEKTAPSPKPTTPPTPPKKTEVPVKAKPDPEPAVTANVPKPVPVVAVPKPVAPEIAQTVSKPVVPEVKPVVIPESTKPNPPIAPTIPVKTASEPAPVKADSTPVKSEAATANGEQPKNNPPDPVQAAKSDSAEVPAKSATANGSEVKVSRFPRAAHTAVVVPPQSRFNDWQYLAAGLALLAIGCWLFYLHRQARASVHPSIISDSLNRKRK